MCSCSRHEVVASGRLCVGVWDVAAPRRVTVAWNGSGGPVEFPRLALATSDDLNIVLDLNVALHESKLPSTF